MEIVKLTFHFGESPCFVDMDERAGNYSGDKTAYVDHKFVNFHIT